MNVTSKKTNQFAFVFTTQYALR